MKKVLFTATVDSHILAFHLPFLKYFKEKGYEVHVATNGTEEIPYCDKKHTISMKRTPFSLQNLSAIKELKKILEKENFDLIHTNTPMGSVVTRLACKKLKGKKPRVIYMAHGLHFYKGASLKNWLFYYPVEKYLSKYTDTLILINEEDYQFAQRKFKKCKHICYVPGVGIDPLKFQFTNSTKEKKYLREELGLSENDFVLIYPAELNRNKNQKLLIQMMEILKKQYSHIHLLLPGKDSFHGVYQKMVKDKNLEDVIHFLGFRKDIPELLKISDVAVSSSYREGLPVNILEAMFCGLPIVATNVRGHRDLIEPNQNGFLVGCDALSFVQAIQNLYHDKNMRLRMKRENQKRIEPYQLSCILEKMKQIYERKKVVLHLLASHGYSGAENVICSIILSTKENYEAYYCSVDGPIRDILKEKKISFCPLKQLRYFEVRKWIRQLKPDILHAHDFKASLLGFFFSSMELKVSHIHQNPSWMHSKNIKSWLYAWCSRGYQKIIIVSNSILEEYVYKNKIKEKCFEIMNVVNQKEIQRKAKAYYTKSFDVAFFGRLVEEKQPLFFLSILAEYEKKYSPVSACFIGDGPLKEECIKQIHALELQSSIEFLGFQENPFPIIQHCKCVIMPSKTEGFGLTAVESMILNVPVLHSGVGGLKRIFGSDSWFICRTKEEYVEKLHQIYTQPVFPKISLKPYIDQKKFQEKIEKIYEE